jgi:hypothetical protein
MKMTTLLLISAFAFALAACGKKEEAPRTTNTSPPPASAPASTAGVAVGGLTVGNAIAADKKIQGSAGTINAKDTIYVSIDTTGSGEATLKSRWTYLKDGNTTLVKEDTQRVSTTGPATHEFHISKPDGWPRGDYQVELFVNDVSAGNRRFSVT